MKEVAIFFDPSTLKFSNFKFPKLCRFHGCGITSHYTGAPFTIFVVIFLVGKTRDSVLNVFKSITETTKRFNIQ